MEFSKKLFEVKRTDTIFVYGVAGAGKSTIIEEVTRLFKSKGERIVIFYPIGITAKLNKGAIIIYYAFKINSKP